MIPPLATRSSRLIGQIVDGLVALLAGLVVAVIFSPVSGVAVGPMALVVAALYVLLSDGFPNGQSLGKRFAGTAVVDATTGHPCTYGKSLLRNLFLEILGPLDCIFIFGARHQRLGDKAANTIVVVHR